MYLLLVSHSWSYIIYNVQCVTKALSRHTAEVEQSRGYDLAHRLCDSCWGPELTQSPVTPQYVCVSVQPKKKRSSGRECARVCVCVPLCSKQSGICLTGECAESCHRRGGSHGHVFCHLIHSFSIRFIPHGV